MASPAKNYQILSRKFLTFSPYRRTLSTILKAIQIQRHGSRTDNSDVLDVLERLVPKYGSASQAAAALIRTSPEFQAVAMSGFAIDGVEIVPPSGVNAA